MTNLALAMIVKNEEQNIVRCLESVKGLFDEIVIVDTGSTDKTKEVVLPFGVKVYDFKWIDDFAAARNFSFSKVESAYVMWMDADDVILPEDMKKLLKLKETLTDYDSYKMYYNYCQRPDGTSVKFVRERILRNSPNMWKYPVHECTIRPQNYKIHFMDAEITHKRSAEDCKRDSGRNLKILEGMKQRDSRMQYYYGKELSEHGRILEAITELQRFLFLGGWIEDKLATLYILSKNFYTLQQYDAARETCTTALKYDPRRAEFYCQIGQMYYDLQQWTFAIPWFEVASQLSPPITDGTIDTEFYGTTGWVPHDRLCMCYNSIGFVNMAYQANEKALKFRPNEQRLLENQIRFRQALSIPI